MIEKLLEYSLITDRAYLNAEWFRILNSVIQDFIIYGIPDIICRCLNFNRNKIHPVRH